MGIQYDKNFKEISLTLTNIFGGTSDYNTEGYKTY